MGKKKLRANKMKDFKYTTCKLTENTTTPRDRQYHLMMKDSNVGCSFGWFIANHKYFYGQQIDFLRSRTLLPINYDNVHETKISKDEMIHDIKCSLHNIIYSDVVYKNTQETYLDTLIELFDTTPDDVFSFLEMDIKYIFKKLVENNTDKTKLLTELCSFNAYGAISPKFGRAIGQKNYDIYTNMVCE